MQIAFHIGANCTDGDRLLKSVLKNADTLLGQAIAVPGPGRYRSLIRETIAALDGTKPAADTRDILHDTIVENDDMDRVVLGNDNFMCVPNRIFDQGVMYGQAGQKVRALQRLFAGDDIKLFMGIRNPATFLQETFKRADAATLDAYLGLIRPAEIRWSDVVRRIKQDAPDVPITIWCNEDTPLLWEQLIRALSGIDPATPVVGGLDMLSTVISPEGMRVLQDTLRANPPQTNAARHEIIAEIWEIHALEAEIEDEIDLAELDPALVNEMTANYDADVDVIGAMPGVNLIMPFT